MCHTIHEYGFSVMVYGELTGDVNLGASTEQAGCELNCSTRYYIIRASIE